MAARRGLPPRTPQEQSLHWYRHDLPDGYEPWPNDGGSGDVSRDVLQRYAQAHTWQWSGRRVYFISDIHADADAFLLSMIACGGILKTGDEDLDFTLTEEGRRALFIIGGDCFDKGPHNLRVLEIIHRLYLEGAEIELLAGNHDVRTLIGIRHAEEQDPLLDHLFVRMGNKTVPLLKEIHDWYVAPGEHTADRQDERALDAMLFPNQSWYREFPRAASEWMSSKRVEEEMSRVRQKTREFQERAEHLDLDLNQVYAAVRKFRELFLEPGGRYYWFFDRMMLTRREGNYLFVHAGVDDTAALMIRDNGVDHLNAEFKRLLKEDPFGLYHGTLGNVFRTKYRERDFPLTRAGVEALHAGEIYGIVHGHRKLARGQRLTMREGMLHVECDATIDRNTREADGLAGIGAAAVVFTENGVVNGISTDYPYIKSFDPGTASASSARSA